MYGRARRIALVKITAIILGIIIFIFIIFTAVFNVVDFQEKNDNFEYLRDYLIGQGYICKLIEQDGGSCVLKKSNSKYTFVRYDNGFYYLVDTNNYRFRVNYLENESNKIEFKTKKAALENYKNKTYYCVTKGSLEDELKECVTNTGEKLNVDTYLGVVETHLFEVNNILSSSGYEKDVLLKKYIWEK